MLKISEFYCKCIIYFSYSVFFDLLDDSGFYHVSIDMNPYKTGMYTLTSSDLKIKVFLLKTANIPAISSLFGLLELNLNGDKVNITTEQLQFFPKKIRWQYNLYKSDQQSGYDDTLDDTSLDSSNNSMNWVGLQNIESEECCWIKGRSHYILPIECTVTLDNTV